jgi:hypothetical protein
MVRRAISAGLAASAMLLANPAGLAFADEPGGTDTPSAGGDGVGTSDSRPFDPDVRALTEVAPRATLQQTTTARLRTELRELHTATMDRFGNMASGDIHSLMIIVMKDAADDAREDMKAKLEAVRNQNGGGPVDPCPGCDP